MSFVKKIVNSIKRLFVKKGRYVNIHEAREIQKYKEYYGKKKY
jgi:hypothetical protein